VITLSRQLATGLEQPQALQRAVQQAVMLEHSTIPPYLYALYSIDDSRNAEIYELVRSVVIEEMTHMALAANLLNALGGAPVIDAPGFIPTYPGRLPGSVESGLVVGLERFSIDLAEHVFMAIEEPLEFPALDAADPHLTIGEFYAAIREQLPRATFTGDPARQVTHELIPDLTAITDGHSATAAIDLIVEQGEGTSTSPLEGDELAHYYRFAEIVHGRRLEPDPDAGPETPPEKRFAYTGSPIELDPEAVTPVLANPTADAYATGSYARRLCDTFNYTYTSALRSLHAAFNGHPAELSASIGLMESCKEQALALMRVEVAAGRYAGPSFEYRPTNPS
jgi:rubrerythrin